MEIAGRKNNMSQELMEKKSRISANPAAKKKKNM
jgi:hypothetical protein